VRNTDIVDFVPDEPYGAIVALSTMEHVAWDGVQATSDEARGARYGHPFPFANALAVGRSSG
jgi:hypothetical protein